MTEVEAGRDRLTYRGELAERWRQGEREAEIQRES